MRLRHKVYLTIIALLIFGSVTFSMLRIAVDCTLRVYYVDGSGTTITVPKTYAGKWLSTVNLATKIDGYTLTKKVSKKHQLALGNKSIVLQYVANQSRQKINKKISSSKYLGVASQLINTRQTGERQIDPLDGTAILRIVTSKNGKRWETLPINYPNVNIRYPRIFKNNRYWLIVGDNQILSTDNFSKWNYSKLVVNDKRFAGVYNPNLIKYGNKIYIVFQSWKKVDGSDTALYYASFNAGNSSIGTPKKLNIGKTASNLEGFSITKIKDQLNLAGVDTRINKVLMYQATNLSSRFVTKKLTQSRSADNLSTVSLMNIDGINRVYYSSYRVSGSIGWRNNVKYINTSNGRLNYSKSIYINSDTLLSNLSILKNN